MADSGALAPFRRGRFEDLPELPHRPHPYFDTEALTVEVPDVGGLGPMRVHVRKHGAGPPLLLVHGLMTSSYSWRYTFERLGARFTCYAPDLPANGRSDAPMGAPYWPDTLARWLGAVQSALDIRGCPVIGNSMGGYLGMIWALNDPGAMSRLVNLHSPGVPELRLDALRVALAIPGVRAILTRVIGHDPLRWAHRNVHYWDESLKSLEEAREYGGPLSTPTGARGLVKYLAETMHTRPMRAFQRALAERRESGPPFPGPLQRVYAERDPMVPPRHGATFAERIPGAQLVTLAEASHFAHVDATDRFLDVALPFLA